MSDSYRPRTEAECFLCGQHFRTMQAYLIHRFESPDLLIVRKSGCHIQTAPRARPSSLFPTAAISGIE